MDEQYEQREDVIPENYEEPMPERPPDGSPSAADFSDYDEYVKALVDFRVKQAGAPSHTGEPPSATDFTDYDKYVAAMADYKIRQALSAPPPPPQPNPDIMDDPHGAERAELIRQSLEYGKQSLMCKEAGDTKKFHDWRERQRQVEKDLEKLPPPPEVEYAQKMFEEIDSKSVDLLCREDLADHPMWTNEKMINDASIVVARGIMKARTTLRLPMEISPFGDVADCTPRNMMTVKLPEDQMKRLQSMVSADGAKDPKATERAAWRALHQLGYAGVAERAIKSKERAEKETEGKPHKDPDKMTQKEFTKWRESQGAKRY